MQKMLLSGNKLLKRLKGIHGKGLAQSRKARMNEQLAQSM